VERDPLSRRAFLVALADAFGVSAVALSWPDAASAAHDARVAEQGSEASPSRFFTSADAADVDAIAAAIVPGGATPGAHEAGVVHFIDRALSTFFSSLAPSFRAHLSEFQNTCRKRNTDVATFAALPPERRIVFLRTVDQTPFFEQMRLLTLLGMFSSPAYGGNVEGAGWKLLGFEDRHVFEPPFGWYDRDYPGFEIDPPQTG
jgi:gluconate 2-dehydrogenase subunit 3-like protein